MSDLSLRVEHLTFSYGERVLLADATFHLSRGWTGLVGPNGSGKTTLLRLVAGQREPSSGTILLEPRGEVTVALCPQEVETLEGTVRDFAESDDGLARRLRGRLDLNPLSLERWDTLSPGERKRWQVGAVLSLEPDVLLLDEPTNHLDAEAAQRLHAALASYRGVGLLVSHDRALLDAVTTKTLRLLGGEARLWPGHFSAARDVWTAEELRVHEGRKETRRRLESEAEHLEAARRRLASSSRERSAGARMKGVRDSDARSVSADFRAESAERAHASALRRSLAKTEALDAKLAGVEVRDGPGRELFLRYEPCPRAVVLRYSGDVWLPGAAPSGCPLLRGVSLALRRDEHVVVQGRNGAGKSTLLRALVAAAALPTERVLALPQELTTEDMRLDLEALHGLANDARGRVLQLVHALAVEPDALLKTASPSPGEGRKLRLALGLGRYAWLAVLDEPTNHFDLPAIEFLEAALVEFPGALLVVTHDAHLASRLAATTWHVRDGGVQVASR